MEAQMAAQSIDPGMAKILGQKYWNHFAIQLGHWNPMKVIIMDDEMFRLMPVPAKVELVREMTRFLKEDVMFARDADNFKVWILGPKKIIRPNITVVGNIPIWDPKKKHVIVPKIKIPRPPNAYILYRTDKHHQIKAENPNLHNNEISVITGAMWKGEAPEVRNKYHQKAQDIKAQVMAVHPNYRYEPRKSSEIRRRASRQVPEDGGIQQPLPPVQLQPFEHNAHYSPQVNNKKAGIKLNSDITRRIPGAQRFLPPVVAPGWTPYHLLSGVESPMETDLEEQASAEEAQADDDENMNDPQDFIAGNDEFIGNWDIEAEFAEMLGEI